MMPQRQRYQLPTDVYPNGIPDKSSDTIEIAAPLLITDIWSTIGGATTSIVSETNFISRFGGNGIIKYLICNPGWDYKLDLNLTQIVGAAGRFNILNENDGAIIGTYTDLDQGSTKTIYFTATAKGLYIEKANSGVAGDEYQISVLELTEFKFLEANYPFHGNADDISDNGNDYTLQGGRVFNDLITSGKNGEPNEAVQLNGTSDYFTAVNTETVSSWAGWINPTANIKDLIQFAVGKSIEIDGSGNITTTGLTNVVTNINNKYGNVSVDLNEQNFVYVEFDTITADAIQLGYAGTAYYAGIIYDEWRFKRGLSQSELKSLRKIPPQ